MMIELRHPTAIFPGECFIGNVSEILQSLTNESRHIINSILWRELLFYLWSRPIPNYVEIKL